MGARKWLGRSGLVTMTTSPKFSRKTQEISSIQLRTVLVFRNPESAYQRSFLKTNTKMSLYPSLEDMKVDQMAQAQVCSVFVGFGRRGWNFMQHIFRSFFPLPHSWPMLNYLCFDWNNPVDSILSGHSWISVLFSLFLRSIFRPNTKRP